MALDSQVAFTVNGAAVSVPDDGASLLEVLRDRVGLRSPKDGCSPQGQCGCCTVLVDDEPRVACVTPARRVAGRSITTLEGMSDRAERWADAFCATGASQCGFCTPGIIVRLEALRSSGTEPDDIDRVERGLLAHLCRCTGWRTILDAWRAYDDDGPRPPRDLDRAAVRAALEGGAPQRVAPDVALGGGGFADDTAPPDALVARARWWWRLVGGRDAGRGETGGGEGARTTNDRRRRAADCPSRRRLDLDAADPVGRTRLSRDGRVVVRPGGEPASPLANGGAFGGKVDSVAMSRGARAGGSAWPRGPRARTRARTSCASVRSGRRSPPACAATALGSSAWRAHARYRRGHFDRVHRRCTSRRSTSTGPRRRPTCAPRDGPKRWCCWLARAVQRNDP